jgi:hypothetical protein
LIKQTLCRAIRKGFFSFVAHNSRPYGGRFVPNGGVKSLYDKPER